MPIWEVKSAVSQLRHLFYFPVKHPWGIFFTFWCNTNRPIIHHHYHHIRDYNVEFYKNIKSMCQSLWYLFGKLQSYNCNLLASIASKQIRWLERKRSMWPARWKTSVLFSQKTGMLCRRRRNLTSKWWCRSVKMPSATPRHSQNNFLGIYLF